MATREALDGSPRRSRRPGLRVAVAGADPDQSQLIVDALSAGDVAVEARSEDVADLADSLGGDEPDAVVFRCAHATSADLAVRALRQDVHEARIVVIARAVSPAGMRKALSAGADALVLEAQVEAALPHVLRAVCAGQTCVPSDVRQHLARPALSYREKQILGMVVLGFTNGEIALRVHLAESTVKSHLSTAFAKLGVRSRSEAAAVILDPQEGLGPGILAISEPDEEAEDGAPARAGG